ncbi:Uncharacterised protein [Vibrio cholerae]|nr:Uncharacterised protein [Vibrio cholerae]
MVCSINADHIKQIRRAHWPAELTLHHFVDFGEVCTITHQ